MRIPYRAMILTDEMRRKALEVLESGKSYGGEETQRFEVELATYCGRRYGIATNSGTSLMLLGLEAFGVGPGDEVLMTANAYIGVLAAVVKAGATPVFVDCELETGNLTADAAAAGITSRTRVIAPVHMYGFPCDMDPLLDLARKKECRVLEDAAHALGAGYKGRRTGSMGDLSVFSFSGKMITVFGPGGAGVCDDRHLAEDISSFCDQGRVRAEEISFIRRTDAAWYDLKRIGYNMHLPEICAALGRLQLRMVDEFLAHRRKAAAYCTARFRDADLPLDLPPERPWAQPCYLHYAVRTPRRDDLRQFLRARGIEASVHYPTPLHLLGPIRAKYGTREGQFPAAERQCRETLSLPVGPHMTQAMLDQVADGVVAFFREGPRPERGARYA